MKTGIRIVGAALPNIPWADAPEGCDEPVWRYAANPIIARRPFRGADRVYNSSVVFFKEAFHGVFRVDARNGVPTLHHGVSSDGLKWKFDSKPLVIRDADGRVRTALYRYDPRLTRIGGLFYVVWCDGNDGPTVGIAATRDFKTYRWLGNAFPPFNRNGVPFPKKVGGDYLLLNRPSDNAHTRFGDIFLSRSKNMVDWGRHVRLMGRGPDWWEGVKIGAGPVPIETTEGWLLFYHGVLSTCNGLVYSMGAALLDRDRPERVLRRGDGYLLTPEMPYECVGTVPNVVFPCAALTDAKTGRIAIYYGAADTVTALCFTTVERIFEWLQNGRRG